MAPNGQSRWRRIVLCLLDNKLLLFYTNKPITMMQKGLGENE